VSDDRQALREVPTGELRRIVAAGLYGKSREEIAGFAKEIGLTLTQLRELVSPSVPSAQQVAQLAERMTTATDESWLRKLRGRAEHWCRNAAEAGDAEAKRRVGDLLTAIERRLAALRPPRASRYDPRDGSDILAPAQTLEPVRENVDGRSTVVDLPTRWERPAPRGDRRSALRMPKGDGFDWLR